MAQALIVIDTQHDFLREGNLASDRCLAVLPTIQREVDRALNAGERVFFTADTHEETELEGLLPGLRDRLGLDDGLVDVLPVQIVFGHVAAPGDSVDPQA